MKGIFRGLVVALVVFVLYWGARHAVYAYERHKLDVGLSERIDALPRAQQRLAALVVYLGFYTGGGKLVPAMCKAEGVDLGAYASAYSERFASDRAAARTAIASLGSSEREVADLMSASEDTRKQFQDALETIGNRFGKGSTVTAGCEAIASKQATVLDYMDFRKSYPETWKRTELP